ncbi:MAG: glycosyltransferase involved in cell wall biosynthesis [Algoriphagus sp.]|jgi:glycosyltransferase involved in cell wall biosynthesis
MRKIVYVGNNLPAKNPTTLVQLSALLGESGFNVTIYSTKKNKLLRLFAMCNGVLKHRNADYLLIDTYSTTNFLYALIVSQLARLLSIKYIPILHGGNLPIRLQQNPWLSRLIFVNSYVNVAPSKYLLNKFKKRNFNTVFIPNVIAIEKYAFEERVKLQPKVLWVRAFDKIYNPLMAIKVLILLKLKYPKAKLCMVGPDKDGSMEQAKELAEQKGVLNSVEFTGILTKKAWITKAEEFDIFINTTTVDNIPVSVIEAMALGLPVVSTNVGGMPYLITDSVDGILVESNNAVMMKGEIIELLNNVDKVKKITKNARKKAEKFDAVFVKQQWINLLK